ncbi:nuclear transport factor 2 family protein [Dokdonia sinensis]|uniref:Nuclear transport factor 2 family protein n=1 Tax=Dokdonia sinensis TaxID=2479847 RepID=A0A3M0GUJ4_9FLAO|nr:nuclear transport factor 2 family protein [Dokdonia sinensis]RMB60996.1 nuclear transport factor 2 family protein [Dokdonia sinensis]
MDHHGLIAHFYQSFAQGDAQAMTDCYHENVMFSDPAFGTLHGDKARAMWFMLLERSKGNIQISYSNINAHGNSGSADWSARYPYGAKKRPVVNNVAATFTFKDGKIKEHHDSFSLYKWSQQALGLSGYLLGWSGFMRSKIQAQTNGLLENYMKKNSFS